MTTPEILPCPWCDPPGPGRQRAWVQARAYDDAACRVECYDCGAMGPARDTESEAIARWNAVAAAVQALRDGDVIAVSDDPDTAMIVYAYPLRREWDAITNPKEKE